MSEDDGLSPAAMAALDGLIPEVAGQRHRWYPSPPLEDLEAELWLAACERGEWVSGQAGNHELLRGWLRACARRVQAADEREYRARKAYVSGYLPEDEHFYSLNALRHLVPAYLDGGVSEHPPKGRVESPAAGAGDGSEYGNWPCMMLDIEQGLKSVPEGQARLLERYFSYPQGPGGWTHVEIAGAMGQEPDVLQGRVRRALRALQRHLGGPSPY